MMQMPDSAPVLMDEAVMVDFLHVVVLLLGLQAKLMTGRGVVFEKSKNIQIFFHPKGSLDLWIRHRNLVTVECCIPCNLIIEDPAESAAIRSAISP